MNLLPILLIVHWLHLVAAAVVFGSALYPSYAPTGRYLDRPLRLVVRVAALCALVTAVAETGFARESLPRLALLSFAAMISLSLRRNSWTALTQARALAAVAGTILAAEPFSVAEHRPTAWLVFEAIGLVAVGAWSGGLVPLYVMARSAVGSDPAMRAHVRTAVERAFVLAAGASGLLVLAGIADAFMRTPPAPDVRLGVTRGALIVALFALAAVDRMAQHPRRLEASRPIWLTRSLCLQALLAFALIGTIALAWARGSGR